MSMMKSVVIWIIAIGANALLFMIVCLNLDLFSGAPSHTDTAL